MSCVKDAPRLAAWEFHWSKFDSIEEGCADTDNNDLCDAAYFFNMGKDYLPWAIQDGWKDRMPPTVSISATPNILWPPDHKMIDILINGSAADEGSGLASVNITVTDEYNQFNMTVLGFGSAIQLEASREGSDIDGRVYIITVVAKDKAGNQASATTEVVVPHDMRE